jgi:hypothetical protein
MGSGHTVGPCIGEREREGSLNYVEEIENEFNYWNTSSNNHENRNR